jgi:hypothetical protein
MSAELTPTTQFYSIGPGRQRACAGKEANEFGWLDPVRPERPWTIWRWSGGAPVKVVALPPLGAAPYYGVGAITW